MSSPRLDIRLLGRVDLRVGGRPVRLGGRQAVALVARLALDRRPRGRDAIAADLWPELDTSAASLRQALWLLRTALAAAGLDPDAILDVEADTVGFRRNAPLRLDTDQFRASLEGQAPDPEAAVRLYRGDLAEGLAHECFAAEREWFSDAYEDALALVAEGRLASGDLRGAREAAERLVLRDPLREDAHAVLITVHGLTGGRAQVVRQYRRLREVLARELEVDPMPETELAYRAALSRAVELSRVRATAAGGAPSYSHPPFPTPRSVPN